MRKILFAIILLILLIVTGLTIYQGISIGKFKVLGIKQIIEENEKIELANESLKRLVDNDFPQAVSKLNYSGEEMQEIKKEYEEQAIMISNSKYYMQTEKYKLEFLWTRIGNYAKDNHVIPKMEVTTGTTDGVYNLTITAVGKYPDIASFIYAIENDSRLGFKIEDFSMIQYSSEENSNYVQGKFTCKEIRIDIKSIDGETNDSINNSTSETDNKTQSNTINTNNNNNNITSNNALNNTTTDKENIVNTANT